MLEDFMLRGRHRIRVFVADDHDVVMRGIKDILDEQDDMEVVGTAMDGVQLVDRIVGARPDIILLDVKMPNFDIFEAIDTFISLADREGAFGGEMPNIVLVTSMLDPYLARKAYDVGIAGYLLKEDALSQRLPATIRTVVSGGWVYSQGVQDVLKSPNRAGGRLPLGRDQFVVLRLMVAGYTDEKIAQATGRTIDTIYRIQYRIRVKLGVETNEQAVRKALQEGMVAPGESEKSLGIPGDLGGASGRPLRD